MKILVAYYSRSNITQGLAEEIASKVGADIEQIIPKVNYNGKLGYARGGKDGMSEKIIDLETLKYDPADYDLVYLGVPVWAGKAANPMISYIKQNEGSFKDVKFFVTAKSSGFESAFSQMEKYVGKAPLKTLALKSRDAAHGNHDEELSAFLE